MDYRNRIIGLEHIASADLTSHPGNWRDHPKRQVEALRGVLSEVGIAGALLAYRSARQGGALVVIDGHLRKDAAPQKWPVLILDVDDAEADYILATHDPLAAMAQADAGALDALLSSVQSGEAAVQEMLSEIALAEQIRYGQDEHGSNPAEAAEDYSSKTIRNIQLLYSMGGEYEFVLETLTQARIDCGLDSNSDVIYWMCETYRNSREVTQ